jgi:hypothetical protein
MNTTQARHFYYRHASEIHAVGLVVGAVAVHKLRVNSAVKTALAAVPKVESPEQIFEQLKALPDMVYVGNGSKALHMLRGNVMLTVFSDFATLPDDVVMNMAETVASNYTSI